MPIAKTKNSVMCGLFFLFLISNEGYAQSNLASELAKVHTSYCNQESLTIRDSEPLHFASRLLFETKKSDLDKFEAQLLLGVNSMKEEDRVVLAQILFLSRSTDFEKIQNLLKFSSKNLVIESYRKYFEGYLDITIGSSAAGFQKMSSAINSLPYKDIRLILGFLGKSLESGIDKEKLKPFLKDKESIPNSDPFKVNLLAFENYITSPNYDVEKMTAFTKQAYANCSIDESVALGYAIVLYLDEKNANEAEKILISLTKKFSFYSPLVDLYLARIYLEKRELENYEKFFNLAKSGFAYFGSEDRKILSTLEMQPANSNANDWVSMLLKYGIIIFISILILVVSIRFRKK